MTVYVSFRKFNRENVIRRTDTELQIPLKKFSRIFCHFGISGLYHYKIHTQIQNFQFQYIYSANQEQHNANKAKYTTAKCSGVA